MLLTFMLLCVVEASGSWLNILYLFGPRIPCVPHISYKSALQIDYLLVSMDHVMFNVPSNACSDRRRLINDSYLFPLVYCLSANIKQCCKELTISSDVKMHILQIKLPSLV